jgi:hypothetical protein
VHTKSLLTPELALPKTRLLSEQSNSFVICLLEFGDMQVADYSRATGAQRLAGSSVIAFPYFTGAI